MARVIRPFDFILDAASGWRLLQAENVSLADGPIQLQNQAKLFPPLNDVNGSLGGHTLPRGVALWGNELFIADPIRHQILHWHPCCGPVKPLSTIGGLGSEPRQLDTPLGLALNQRDDLIVVDSGNRRLLLFTLPGLALRRIFGPFERTTFFPSAVEPISLETEIADPETPDSPSLWYPVDVAVGPHNNVYVADSQGFIWQLDAQGRPNRYYRGRLPEGAVPQRLWADNQDRVYVQVEDREAVMQLDRYGRVVGEIASLDAPLVDEPDATLRQQWPASRLSLQRDRVLLAFQTPEQNQLAPQPTDLILDENGYLQLPDGSRGPYLLYRRPPAIFKTNGFYRMQPLDSGRAGNPWHRVVLDLDAPERTSVSLFSFTSDVPRPDVSTETLLEEPPQLGLWQAAPTNADEWLIQSPPGRYLYLTLILKGPGDRTPRVERLYVYQQRQSSLQYLPAAYQSDETSRHLLDRLLSLSDTLFGEIESNIEDFPLQLDIQGAPADFLPWLASWFDFSLLPIWNEDKRRRFLNEIVDLYRWRGTIRGLRRLLQLHADVADPLPQIVEHYRSAGMSLDESRDRAASESLQHWFAQIPAADIAHHFSIWLPAATLNTAEKRQQIEQLIDANKPAHALYSLHPVYPQVRLGSATIPGTALGVNSLLGSHAVWQLPVGTEADGILGSRTMLEGVRLPPAAGQLGVSRLEGRR